MNGEATPTPAGAGRAEARPAITEEAWAEAVRLVSAADEVALVCHVSPDGDALGSMLAFGLALRAAGKRVVASYGDRDFTVPRLLRFLPGQELLVAPAAYPPAPALMISFDASTLDRLGLLRENAVKAEELVVVDHHASNTGFGTRHLIDPAAASTSVLVEEFIRRLGVPLDRDIATGLYTGLVTDTGSFRYASTTPAVHDLAARLLATGLRPEEIARELWDRSPVGYLKVLSTALARAVVDPDALNGLGMVWTYVTRADRAAHGLPYEEVEGIIDVIRRTDGTEVAVVLKEDDEGAWQVSTRSRDRLDVGRACRALGGGGHPKAAGFTSRLPLQETMDRLVALLGGAR